jgi:hypothetical protein
VEGVRGVLCEDQQLGGCGLVVVDD